MTQSFVNGNLFSACLDVACTALFKNQVRYNASITGTISPGQIADLSSIAVQDIFIWFLVLAIRLDDNASGIIHSARFVVGKPPSTGRSTILLPHPSPTPQKPLTPHSLLPPRLHCCLRHTISWSSQARMST
ncbi:hypothetical protein Cni_G07483 [Canna indica]|uniref:Uncharacterized protein n=1 Tax=Canna indica TaxID=4628 RepID=A0AAQ3K269_9LILI|nr:hypothetical protein Cni_G07483 [Canna indica]